MSIEKNLQKVLDQISAVAAAAGRIREEINLIAVSKGRSLAEIEEAYSLGLRDFGENRVDEALEKMENLPGDIRWHYIGKLQKKKVAKAIGRFALIHSVDSYELAEKISRGSLERGLTTAILLEANTSGESSKSGLNVSGWEENFSKLSQLKGIEIKGFMTMAPLTQDEALIRASFKGLRNLQLAFQKKGGDYKVLSMGMSQDFTLAIEEGATILRIGGALFNQT